MHDTPSTTPTLRRRLIAMVYETFLLLAVEMLAVALFLVVTRNNHAPVFQYAMKVWLFVVTGAYFTWGWTNSGHTLAMKTWRIWPSTSVSPSRLIAYELSIDVVPSLSIAIATSTSSSKRAEPT